MKFFIFVALFAIALVAGVYSKPSRDDCPAGMEFHPCGYCREERTCENKDRPCPIICYPPRCGCPYDKVLNRNNVCVYHDEC
ncbi:hypothetical protein CpipJ_CPIJ004897 [Culex quinquefasciatus]|uniref:Uncharacterized protein n=1 Tax=Culex quinquefasciatus TaxID=7176 RepID=B0WCZ3_CULQU|nr:hypothetical protein CpipJ_CPIJ004897 [Culex quinquefasciatus]|eukprot:XP_001846577.1 hypothetical protein CpipJ_CPIJ004897 [Culex quinquefasciatus]